jgi:NADH-quinone oxidoreductase subunit N
MQGIHEKLEWITLSLSYVAPELMLVLGIVVLVIFSVLKKWQYNLPTNVLALALVCIVSLSSFSLWMTSESSVLLFNGMLRHSPLAGYCRLLVDAATILTIVLSWKNNVYRRAEYYALLLTVLLGAHLLVMSVNFVMLFLAIELISLPSYVLAAWGFQKKSMEAALKYFLFGSVASAIMLYGITLLYGITQSLDFTSDAFKNALWLHQSQFLFISICLVLCGLLFKIASAPFHPWAPDVYEAAPMPIVAFFSVVPKVAGVGALATLFYSFSLNGESSIRWHIVLCMVIVLTITIGNFGALLQQNPKRMMAYSSIAQAGFLLMGVVTWSPQGLQSMLFYATVFMVANYIVFYYLQHFQEKGITVINGFAGVGKQHTVASVLLLIGLLSLTGLPPTGGFMAKLFVFSNVWSVYEKSLGALYLVVLVVGLLNTVVSLFFYLKIPYKAFLAPAPSENHQQISFSENLFGVFLVMVLVTLFFLPNGLMGWLISVTFAN